MLYPGHHVQSMYNVAMYMQRAKNAYVYVYSVRIYLAQDICLSVISVG